MRAAAGSDHQGQGPYCHQQKVDIRIEDEAEVGGRVARIPVRMGQEEGGGDAGTDEIPCMPMSQIIELNWIQLATLAYVVSNSTTFSCSD